MNPKYVEALIQALTDQRNAALNQVVQLTADNKLLGERLKEYEVEADTKKSKVEPLPDSAFE
jgi:hypothetical protein